MPKLTVNGREVEVPAGATVLQACEAAGEEIPRFCYHERLSIAGNCRMCLVEMEKSPKPIASCAMPAADGMVIRTNTPAVKKAREGVLEFLLINHPLDCPICDQGGECDLQDETMGYGRGVSRYAENKRAVTEKYIGPLIKTVMTRCIHCTRCIRFLEDVAGVPELGAIYRGENMQITSYLETALTSELQGNVIDLCPVGALTSAPYAFHGRPWELKKVETVDVMDAMGCNIRVDARGMEVMRVLPRLNEEINEEWISDKTRFAYDGLKYRRLDRPWVRTGGRLQEATWVDAFRAVEQALAAVKPAEIAAVVGDLNEIEGMYAFREWLKSLGVTRIEGRQDGTALEPGVRAGYLFNSGLAGIEEADAVLLIGSNPRKEAAVFNTRLLRMARRGVPIARIGVPEDLTYPVTELGADPRVLEALIAGDHPLAEVLRKAERPALILGQGALTRKDGRALWWAARKLAEEVGMIQPDLGWNGFNVLHTAAARVGALDLGLATKEGIAGIMKDAAEGRVKLVFLLGADEFDPAPLKDATVVYIGTHGDRGVTVADIILPAAAYTEKHGVYINTEGRVQWAEPAVPPPGEAREDWKIFRALSEVTGQPLDFDNRAELLRHVGAELPHIARLDERPAADWKAFGRKGRILAAPLVSAVTRFHLTNPIARASRTMAECDRVIDGQQERATGTDG